MKLICKKKHLVRILVAAAAMFLLCQLLLVPVSSAQTAENDEFLQLMRGLAEDIEEIHEDMHTVAFALKIIALSSLGMAGLLFLGVVLLFLFYRKNS